jgi:hypothetical protein
MLSLQEISDRLEIQDLIHRYAQIIDAKDFDLLREEIFCEDAFIDYSAFGGSKGNLEETIAFLHKVMKIFPNTQHLNANIQISLGRSAIGSAGGTESEAARSDPDQATGRIMCLNPQEMKLPGHDNHIFFCGLWYIDRYRRTELGWRIAERIEEKSFVFNAPDFGAA